MVMTFAGGCIVLNFNSKTLPFCYGVIKMISEKSIVENYNEIVVVLIFRRLNRP